MDSQKLGKSISTRLPEKVEKWVRKSAKEQDRKPAHIIRILVAQAYATVTKS